MTQHGFELLALAATAHPGEVVDAVHRAIDEIHAGERKVPRGTSGMQLRLGLACALADALHRGFGWQWASVGPTQTAAVVSPTRTHATVPLAPVGRLAKRRAREHARAPVQHARGRRPAGREAGGGRVRELSAPLRAYAWRVRTLMAIVLAAVGMGACAPAPIVRPPGPKSGPAPGDPPEIERELTHETAPGGVVQTKDGSTLELASLWATQRVVLIFYRGHWCPHCQYQLGELNKRFADFKQAGVTLAAISTDTTTDVAAMHQRLGLLFELYSDPTLGTIAKFGVDDYGNGISRPATFVIQRGGEVTFKRVGDRPDDRPSVDEILAALKE